MELWNQWEYNKLNKNQALFIKLENTIQGFKNLTYKVHNIQAPHKFSSSWKIHK